MLLTKLPMAGRFERYDWGSKLIFILEIDAFQCQR